VDGNSNLLYDEGAEEMAFEDSVIIPSAVFVEKLDTLATDLDTIIIMGHTDFYPEPVYLRQFTEDIFEQYLKTIDKRYPLQMHFCF
jgi:hypothetical protein